MAYASESVSDDNASSRNLTWREGEFFVFDDSFEHEVWHRGDVDRVVLLINFWHPDLPESERKIELNTFGYQPI